MLALSFFCADCERPAAVNVNQAANSRASFASTVYTGDPESAPQLINGFFKIEDYSWRWTAQSFSVVLRPPDGRIGESATLAVALAVPDAETAKLGNVTLSARIGNTSLAPETYTKPGMYTYQREVLGNLLTQQEVRIDFQLDKFLVLGGQDVRRLGIVVKSIGLESR